MNEQAKQETTKPVPRYDQVTERILFSGISALAVMVGLATIITAVNGKE